MKAKSTFIIIATILSIWAFWSGALGADFEKNGGGKSRIVLTIDKNAVEMAQIQQAFHNFSKAVGDLFSAVFSTVDGPELVKTCKEQPVLFGGLFIFFGVSLCGIGFVVHMIRTDSRFS